MASPIKRFETQVALGMVVLTVFEDRTVIEFIANSGDPRDDQLYQIPFTEKATKAIREATEPQLSIYPAWANGPMAGNS